MATHGPGDRHLTCVSRVASTNTANTTHREEVRSPRDRHRVRFNHIAQIRLLHLVSLLGRDYADKHAIVSSLCANG